MSRLAPTQVPGVSQLPLVGRLFQSRNDAANKTEIVLLITPRVIRNIERPGMALEHFNSGTEMDVGGAGGGSAAVPAPGVPPQSPIPPPPAAPAPIQSRPR